MATYVPIIGSGTDFLPFTVSVSLALAPNGSLWLASGVGFYGGGAAQTLVAVRGDGAAIIDSESLRFTPIMAFDTDGSALLLTLGYLANLPTSLDAGLRVPCLSPATIGFPLYLAKKSAIDGSLIEATYLDASAAPDVSGTTVVTFDGLDRIFVFQGYPTQNIAQVDPTPPTQPGRVVS